MRKNYQEWVANRPREKSKREEIWWKNNEQENAHVFFLLYFAAQESRAPSQVWSDDKVFI